MPRIESIFADRRSRSLKTLMPFVVGGRPTIDQLGPVLAGLERGGASIVEIGIPFSDPIADGPVIAASMHRAIQSGVTPHAVLDAIARVRPNTGLGLVAMVSVSIVHRIGAERFIADASRAGIDGFIFPDAPAEEAEPLMALVRAAGLTASLLVAPTTPPHRLGVITRLCSGFVYLLARMGLTGHATPTAPADVAARVAALRQATDLPIACGFGISTAAQVREVVSPDGRPGAGADAAIVGSALVGLLEEKPGEAPEAAEKLCRQLAAGLA